MRRVLALTLALMAFSGAAHAETLRFYTMYPPDSFIEAHPEVTIDTTYYQSFETTAAFAGALQTRTFPHDVFHVETTDADLALLMEKGYLLDLTDSDIIRSAVERMHPFIAQRCMANGRIYAVPDGFAVLPVLSVNAENWAEAGYSEQDVPQSFPALLGFIEGYLDRRDAEPNLTFSVWHGLDGDGYDARSYGKILIHNLLRSHVQQCQFAGEPVRFGTPEVLDLLERAIAIGERIHTYEPSKSQSQDRRGLFMTVSLGANARWDEPLLGSLRLSEAQPRLLAAVMTFNAVSASTPEPALATEALEHILTSMWDTRAALLYTDAQPIPNGLAASDRMTLNLLALAEHRLNGDDTPWADYLDLTPDPDSNEDSLAFYAQMAASLWDSSDQEVRDQRDRWESLVTNRDPYRFSPEELSAYQRMAPTLFLPGPSVFDGSGEANKNYAALVSQLSDGLITPDQFAREADRIAEMAELEGQ